MTIENIAKKLVSWKKFVKSQKAIFLAAFFLLIFGSFFSVSAAHAQANTFSGSSIFNAFLDGFSWLMMKIAGYALSLVMFVLAFIIQVASYNGYLDAVAVNTGWVLVRDITNMVFVVALLAIAFGTILGIEHYEWKHMLFKLVSAAILVNFSRIICGILIDISQVVMMTFLNGIAATLSGNIIRAFSLDGVASISKSASGVQFDPTTVWLSAAAALFLSVTVLVVMCALLFMLIARMIVLWVLIVLSPIAFVMGVLHKTEHYAEEWWKEFGNNVITGPVLIFFLWLTLVTVGSGTANQDLARGSASIGANPSLQSTGVVEVLTGDKLINFAIAIGMLLVGLRVTQHLGGIGADWTGSAVNYGKKAVMMASGIAVTRSAASKGYAVGKAGVGLAAMKVPYVGGDALNRYKKDIKATATNKWAKYQEGRVIKQNKNLEASQDMNRNWLQRQWSKVKMNAGPGVGLDKITGNRVDEAHARMEALGKVSSTSKHPASKRAMEAEIRLEELAATGNLKKEGKEVDVKEWREEMYKIFDDKTLTKSERDAKLKEKTAEMRKGKVLSETDIKELDHDYNRREGARDTSVTTAQKEGIHHLEDEEAMKKRTSKLGAQIQVGGKKFKRDDATLSTTAALLEHEMQVSNMPVAEQEAMRAKFYKGEEVQIGGQVVELEDHTEAALERAKAKVRKARENNFISANEEKEYDKALEYQRREKESAHLSKVAGQMGQEVQSQKGREEAKTEEHLREHDTEYQAREARITGFTAEMNQIQDKIAGKRQLDLLASIKELLAKDLERGKDSRQTAIYEAKAKAEQLEFEKNNEKELLIASARDKYLSENGRGGEAVNYQNAMAKQTKMRMEMQSVGDYVLSTERTKMQIAQIEDLKARGASKEEIQKAERSLAEMTAANLGRHAAFYGGNAGIILGQDHIGADKTEISMELSTDKTDTGAIKRSQEAIRQRQAQLLSSLINEKVSADRAGIEAAKEKLKSMFGGDQEKMNSFLEQVRQQTEAAAGQGSIGLAGLLNTRYVNGKQVTDFTDVEEVSKDGEYTGLKHVAGRRVNGLSGAKITSLSGGFSGSVDRVVKTDSTGKTTSHSGVKSAESIDMVVRIVSPLTNNQMNRVDEYTKRDMSEVLEYSEIPALETMIKKLSEEAADDKAARTFLLQSIVNFSADSAEQKKQVETLIDKYIPEKGGGKK